MESLKQRIFKAISESGPISRMNISEQYGIRLATITERANELLEQGLIVEIGEDRSSGGRRPILLSVNSESFYALGIHISCGELTIGLYNSGLKLICSKCFEIRLKLDNSSLLTELRNAINMVVKDNPDKRIAGIGIGFPGRVDYKKGIFIQSGVLPDPKNVPVKTELEKMIGIPVYLDHNVTSVALAEYYLGFVNDVATLGIIMMETKGIGSQFILNGEPLRGANNSAGEFGHLSIDTNGPECYCGNHGCFELLAGIPALEQESGDTFEHLIARAEQGETAILELFERTGRYIGEAILNILHFMDCEKIVLNGKMIEVAKFFDKSMHEKLNCGRIFRFAESNCQVVYSRLGNGVAELGAALTAVERVYHEKYDLDIFKINFFRQK